jgi:hypothetical protein
MASDPDVPVFIGPAAGGLSRLADVSANYVSVLRRRLAA